MVSLFDISAGLLLRALGGRDENQWDAGDSEEDTTTVVAHTVADSANASMSACPAWTLLGMLGRALCTQDGRLKSLWASLCHAERSQGRARDVFPLLPATLKEILAIALEVELHGLDVQDYVNGVILGLN